MIIGPRTLYALAIIWVAIAIGGMCWLTRYSAKAGIPSTANNWPAGTSITRTKDCYFLLAFVHPQCPCSASTLEELNRLIAKCNGRMAATIVFAKPSANNHDWLNTPLWTQASGILNVKLISDVGGAEAARFDASTSGQVFLFDPSGHLRFQGGITASRGHSGDNDGEDCIAQIVAGNVPPSRSTPVYGCGLFNCVPPRPKGQVCNH